MDRRKFLGSLSVGGLGLMGLPSAWAEDSDTPVLFPVPTNTGITGKVVVVGGGMAGAAVAKYLRLWGGTGVSVTLVEASPSYTSNIMSNTVLTGPAHARQPELHLRHPGQPLRRDPGQCQGHRHRPGRQVRVTGRRRHHQLRPPGAGAGSGLRPDARHVEPGRVRHARPARVEGRPADPAAAQPARRHAAPARTWS